VSKVETTANCVKAKQWDRNRSIEVNMAGDAMSTRTNETFSFQTHIKDDSISCGPLYQAV
jgi:hypothetical protein